jgi:hypothetical protein
LALSPVSFAGRPPDLPRAFVAMTPALVHLDSTVHYQTFWRNSTWLWMLCKLNRT